MAPRGRKKKVLTESADASGTQNSLQSEMKPFKPMTDRQRLGNSLIELASKAYFGSLSPYTELLRDIQTGVYPDTQTKAKLEDYIAPLRKKAKHTKEVILSPLDILVSSLRVEEELDLWTCKEIALLNAMAQANMDFFTMTNFLSNKSVADIQKIYDLISK
jgi:hypothetical protein